MEQVGLKVFAPASVANLAVGYDILGLAINGPGDEVIFRPGTEPGMRIVNIHNHKGKLPKELLKNTVGVAAHEVWKAAGSPDISLDIEIFKKMPIGTGMGSSAASAAAGAYGMNLYLLEPFTKKELLPFAVTAEKMADGSYHADNVAPALLGGVVLIRENASLDFVRLPVPRGLKVVLIYPPVEVLTKESRAILSNEVSLDKHILQSGNLAAFVSAMYTSDFDLIQRSLKDLIIEPQRAQLIPHFYDIKKIALEAGALGFSISGAGPSMFALTNNSLVSEAIKEKALAFYKSHNIEATVHLSDINSDGAIKC